MSMRKIYRKIARKNHTTAQEVRQEIQFAINDAYKNPPCDGGIIAAYQRRVPHRGEVPTPEEMIRYAAAAVRLKPQNGGDDEADI